MKTFFFSLPVLLVIFFASCEKEEEQLLEDIAGTYEVTNIVLSGGSSGDTSFMPGNLLLVFRACDLNNNQQGGNCELDVEGDEEIFFSYQIEASGNQSSLTINPEENTAEAQASIIFEILRGRFDYTTTDDILELTASSSATFPFQIDGKNYTAKQISATRR